MRVLELYCGMGGMHWALKMTSLPYEIVAAVEINPNVLENYCHNFSETNVLRRNIQSLTSEELNEMQIDMIVMSPPCQPFCRTGLQLDTKDARTSSLNELCKVLPLVNFQYIVVENVQGFETSDAREELLTALRKSNLKWQEFLLNPTTLGIPNSRLRYYLIGKKSNLTWRVDPTNDISSEVPLWDQLLNDVKPSPYSHIVKSQKELWANRRKINSRKCELKDSPEEYSLPVEYPWCVGDILDHTVSESGDFSVPTKVVLKYGKAMDIVCLKSTTTCCFTKGYGNYIKGTGSILNVSPDSSSNTGDDALCLRYFTPKEISYLMCYPNEFKLSPNLTVRQHYRSLGNSLNVYVVAVLIALLVAD